MDRAIGQENPDKRTIRTGQSDIHTGLVGQSDQKKDRTSRPTREDNDQMKKVSKTEMDDALDWSRSVLGPVKVMSDHSKMHGGHESSTCRLQAPIGFCYLKVHQSQSHWNNEVHAYEHWACAFGDFVPKLLAVSNKAPLVGRPRSLDTCFGSLSSSRGG